MKKSRTWSEQVNDLDKVRYKPELKRLRKEEREGTWKWWIRSAAVIVILVLLVRFHVIR